MDVRLSAEQRALRDSVVQVVGKLGAQTVRDLDDGERAAKLDAAIDAAGWRELRAGDDVAPWASAVEVAIIAEELAYGVVDAPFLGPTLAADLRRRAGAPTADRRETIFLASDLTALGDATAIDAHGAQQALVLVERDGPALGYIELGEPAESVDLTRVVVPRRGAEWHPVPDQSRRLRNDDLIAWMALGLAITSAELVGTMRGACDLATGYAAERRQYGRPVGSFQAVQHLLADAFVAMEGARSTALHAAWAVDALPPAEAMAAGAMAKAWCSRAARSVCETAIQVHGGIGNTWECLAHVHLRRALLSIDVLGGTGPNLDRVLEHSGIGGTDGLR